MLKKWKEDNYMVVQLDRGRANAMNGQMLNAIKDLFTELATDDTVDGVVLTGKQGFFSGGLDVIELYAYDKKEIRALWTDFFYMVKALVSFPKPLVASITGHSPAGGCVLAICCDYRVMAEGKYRIGLNEIPVAIPIPEYIFALYSFWLGKGPASRYLLEGKLHTVAQAKACNLVDEICADEEVLERAKAKLKKYLKLDKDAWRLSKKCIRQELHAAFDIDISKSMDVRMEQWWRPNSRRIMGAIVDSLQAKK